MDLWIRSQDKEYLTKVEQLEIREQDEHHKICSINFQNTYGYNFMNLGDYKSKERALEILDEIQNLLVEQINLGTYSIDNKFTSRVYEMPKE